MRPEGDLVAGLDGDHGAAFDGDMDESGAPQALDDQRLTPQDSPIAERQVLRPDAQ
jgi:hypothetical protein